MVEAKGERADQRAKNDGKGWAGIEIAGSKGQVRFIHFVDLHVEELVEAHDVHVHEQSGRQSVQRCRGICAEAGGTNGRHGEEGERGNAKGATDHRVWPTEAPQHAERPCDVEGPRGLDICGLGSCGLNVAVVDKRCSLCPLVDAAGDSGLQSKPRSQGKRGA